MRRSEGKHLLVAVASLQPLAKRQTRLKLLDGESVIVGDLLADKFQSRLKWTENLIQRFLRKRPSLARGLGVDAHWLPIPWQELVEAVGGVTVGHARQSHRGSR
jgi:hypothetical protein